MWEYGNMAITLLESISYFSQLLYSGWESIRNYRSIIDMEQIQDFKMLDVNKQSL
jgi:hypothetical protein